MKRQYWRRGKDRRRRGWLVWLAIAGLIASYVYGALGIVPLFEAHAGRRYSDSPSSAVAAVEPEPVDQTSTRSPVPAAGKSTQLLVESSPPSRPATQLNACVAAMAAALTNARVEFLSSSVEIVPASRNVISVLAALAHVCPGRIQIAGHSDNLGPEAVNMQISVARAESVANAFVEYGLAPERLSVRGLGSTQPMADNTTRAGRARNRRIEMSLVE